MPKLPKADLLILDPPFDEWKKFPEFKAKTIVAFTNYQNRQQVIKKYGKPRCELIWHFKDGRWVSHKLPRITHENILIYGKTGKAYVGEINNLKSQRKGRGSIGRHKMEQRTYVPRKRKQLNSVLEYPQHVGNPFGIWAKPLDLMKILIEWLSEEGDYIIDCFMGSGTTAVACQQLNRTYTGIEINPDHYKMSIERTRQQTLNQILPVPIDIELIKRLRAEGNNNEAEKLLEAFRNNNKKMKAQELKEIRARDLKIKRHMKDTENRVGSEKRKRSM